MAIEEQDLQNNIEIHTYLTGKIKEDDLNNIFTNDVGGERDTVTDLRAPTHVCSILDDFFHSCY